MKYLGRIFLFIAGLFILWWAFLRKPMPVVVNQGIDPNTGRVLGTSENISATANQAVANTINAAGQATAQGTGQILGVIFDGIAQSVQGDRDSGSYGSSTSTGAGSFFDDSSFFGSSSDNSYDTTL